jgi:hypothetical protein
MKRIAKKPRVVKRRKKEKPSLTPPRFTIRKDSLDRRYAIDKRTGQRVSLYKAEKERKQRRKTAKPIPQYKPPKRQKPAKTKARQPTRARLKLIASNRAKKGWETRRARAKARSEAAKKGWAKRKAAVYIPPVEDIVPISTLTPEERLVPKGVLLVSLTGVADRMAIYPNVKRAAESAFAELQLEAWRKRAEMLEGKHPPKMTREEQIQSNIRDLIAERITNPADIDRVVAELYDQLDGEFTVREIYTLYFSPDVA